MSVQSKLSKHLEEYITAFVFIKGRRPDRIHLDGKQYATAVELWGKDPVYQGVRLVLHGKARR